MTDKVPRAADVVVEAVTKGFGSEPVLRQLDLEMAPGESVAILGPSGSGKTTLLRILAGLETPDSGRVLLGGRVVSKPGWALAPHERSIGFAFQRPALWPHMTVAQNIAFALAGVPRGEASARVAELQAELELDGLDQRYPDELSGGQARRVSLARALVAAPRRVLLDEPFAHLEPDLRRRLAAAVLARITQSGAGLVHVTHDAGDAEALSERALTLRDGRLEELVGG
ncbi:MAG: ABC transporter ATP-binding protein [Anaerolineae bacterium]|jgi:ABC-type Fe3+/spermidine/putrescine transport system ATPase subunit